MARHRWSTRRAVPYGVVVLVYLVVSMVLWWHVWTGHPSTMTTCGCGDPASSLWFTAWPAYAIAHGHNPLFSTAVGYPNGISLVFASFGVALTPLTWLVGPVAALNVALTLSPVVSALAMFALVRRWTSWMPAAFAAGLIYGFSPFVVSNLGSAHIDFVMVAAPPLVVICLDELLIRQRRPPVPVGVVLGLLVALQFLVGVEVVVLLAIEVAIGLVLILLHAWRRDPTALERRARTAAPGVVAAAIASIVALAVPGWLAVAGPAHIVGAVHPGVALSTFNGSFHGFVVPTPPSTQGAFSSLYQQVVGGYQGPVLSQQYVGLGLFVVAIGGIVVWKRDPLLQLFGLMTLASLFLVVASGDLFAGLPLLGNIIPVHFVLFVYLAGAVLAGIVTDRARPLAMDAWARRLTTRPAGEGQARQGRIVGAIAGVVVALVAIVPPAAYVAQGVPLTITPIVPPRWFSTVAPHLTDHPVVLALPAPFTVTKAGYSWHLGSVRRISLSLSGKQSAMAWQALSGQRYSIVGGGGLGAGVAHSPRVDHGQDVISRVTFAYGTPPVVTAGDSAAVARALSAWRVTTVVLPDEPNLPAYDRVASVTDMAALITGATGIRPTLVADSWVWNGIRTAGPATFPDATEFARCTGGQPPAGTAAVEASTACVLATST